MSKFLRTAALVVGAVALAATGVGAAASAGLISVTAATAATISTIATVAGVAAGFAGIGAALLQNKPLPVAAPMTWDPGKAAVRIEVDEYFGAKVASIAALTVASRGIP